MDAKKVRAKAGGEKQWNVLLWRRGVLGAMARDSQL